MLGNSEWKKCKSLPEMSLDKQPGCWLHLYVQLHLLKAVKGYLKSLEHLFSGQTAPFACWAIEPDVCVLPHCDLLHFQYPCLAPNNPSDAIDWLHTAMDLSRTPTSSSEIGKDIRLL